MYLSMNKYFTDTFGTKGYKIALKGGMTCPNRDGRYGTEGCVFCDGAGAFAQSGISVTEQIDTAISRVEHKNKNGVYIAYFQDYTNTYAPIAYLKQLFYEAILHPRVAVLSIATRPDCLPEDVLALLRELNRIKPVWVELGLQTIHERTAAWIGRGYPTSVYDKALGDLHAIGIRVITHLIIGLPFETEDMIYQSTEHVSRLGTDGVKFHLLHVLKHTKLHKLYLDGQISTLSFAAYARILAGCINRLQSDIVIHRITGDGDKRTLVAPMWSADKKHVLNSLTRYFQRENVRQGKLVLDNKKNMEYNSEK